VRWSEGSSRYASDVTGGAESICTHAPIGITLEIDRADALPLTSRSCSLRATSWPGTRTTTDADARARWPHAADFADALAESGKPAVVLFTDFAALHVGKLTRIAFGNDPTAIRKEAPTYYAHRRVAMWFRLGDLRALSYETYRTAEWQRAHLGPVLAGARRRGRPYDRPHDVAPRGSTSSPFCVARPHADVRRAVRRAVAMPRRSLLPAAVLWSDAPHVAVRAPRLHDLCSRGM
jgi:hypothetical protein